MISPATKDKAIILSISTEDTKLRHNQVPAGTLLLIEIPAKIWRPKAVSCYRILEYYGEDIDIILDYGQYGNCLYRTKLL